MWEREETKSLKKWIASNLREFAPPLSWIYHVEIPSLETRVLWRINGAVQTQRLIEDGFYPRLDKEKMYSAFWFHV
jgi:hypothetical protein